MRLWSDHDIFIMKKQEHLTNLKQPLRRYSLERLVRRVSHESQMDRIIKSMSRPKKKTSKHTIEEEESLDMQKGTPQRETGIMKKIINNDMWNELIEREYRKQKSKSPKKQPSPLHRPLGKPRYSNTGYEAFPNLLKRLNPLKTRHKTQPTRCDEWFFFDRRPHNATQTTNKTSNSSIQVIQSPSATHMAFKSKRINWRKGPLPHYSNH